MAITAYDTPLKAKVTDSYVSQYIPLPFEEMRQSLAAKQMQQDTLEQQIASATAVDYNAIPGTIDEQIVNRTNTIMNSMYESAIDANQPLSAQSEQIRNLKTQARLFKQNLRYIEENKETFDALVEVNNKTQDASADAKRYASLATVWAYDRSRRMTGENISVGSLAKTVFTNDSLDYIPIVNKFEANPNTFASMTRENPTINNLFVQYGNIVRSTERLPDVKVLVGLSASLRNSPNYKNNIDYYTQQAQADLFTNSNNARIWVEGEVNKTESEIANLQAALQSGTERQTAVTRKNLDMLEKKRELLETYFYGEGEFTLSENNMNIYARLRADTEVTDLAENVARSRGYIKEEIDPTFNVKILPEWYYVQFGAGEDKLEEKISIELPPTSTSNIQNPVNVETEAFNEATNGFMEIVNGQYQFNEETTEEAQVFALRLPVFGETFKRLLEDDKYEEIEKFDSEIDQKFTTVEDKIALGSLSSASTREENGVSKDDNKAASAILLSTLYRNNVLGGSTFNNIDTQEKIRETFREAFGVDHDSLINGDMNGPVEALGVQGLVKGIDSIFETNFGNLKPTGDTSQFELDQNKFDPKGLAKAAYETLDVDYIATQVKEDMADDPGAFSADLAYETYKRVNKEYLENVQALHAKHNRTPLVVENYGSADYAGSDKIVKNKNREILGVGQKTSGEPTVYKSSVFSDTNRTVMVVDESSSDGKKIKKMTMGDFVENYQEGNTEVSEGEVSYIGTSFGFNPLNRYADGYKVLTKTGKSVDVYIPPKGDTDTQTERFNFYTTQSELMSRVDKKAVQFNFPRNNKSIPTKGYHVKTNLFTDTRGNPSFKDKGEDWSIYQDPNINVSTVPVFYQQSTVNGSNYYQRLRISGPDEVYYVYDPKTKKSQIIVAKTVEEGESNEVMGSDLELYNKLSEEEGKQPITSSSLAVALQDVHDSYNRLMKKEMNKVMLNALGVEEDSEDNVNQDK